MPTPQKIQIIDFLEKDFINVISDDLLSVLQFHEKQQSGGFHSIPREVFCYIDYLGFLRFGSTNTSDNAIKYIEKYLSKADIKYKHYGKLLYEMWRHGTVHEFDPKVLKHSRRKYKIGWQANNDSSRKHRDLHLECFKVQGLDNIYIFHINLFELVDDLRISINDLASELRRKPSLAAEVQYTFDELSKPITVRDLPRKGKSIKRNLNLQITRAIKSQKREVNKGQVV